PARSPDSGAIADRRKSRRRAAAARAAQPLRTTTGMRVSSLARVSEPLRSRAGGVAPRHAAPLREHDRYRRGMSRLPRTRALYLQASIEQPTLYSNRSPVSAASLASGPGSARVLF